MSAVNFINTKAKAFVVFIFSIISLGILVLGTFFSMLICQRWYGIIVGVILMVAAIPFHWAGKKKKWGYLISFLLNSIGNGFSLSALYLSKNIALDLYGSLVAIIPAVGILLLTYLMLQIFHKTKRVTLTVAGIINAIFAIAFITFWILDGNIFFSFGFFGSLISLFYLCVFGVTINHDKRSVLRDISFGSFGSFIILTVVVIFILSEGEILDGLDLPEIRRGKKKNSTPKGI